MFVYYNPNPYGKQVGDCTVRALTMFLGLSWFDVYDDLYADGREIGDMPSGNAVWASYLRHLGFENVSIVNMCPDCFVWRGCCESVAIRNTSDQPIQVQNANVIISRPDLAVTY